MKKKFITALLCAAMTASMLAGCGSNNGGNSGGNDANADANADAGDDANADANADAGDDAEGASGDENTLTVWCWDPKFNIYAMEQAGKVYQAEHPEFNVNVVETPWDDVQKKLTTAATGGAMDTLPDIMLVQDNAFQKNVISFPEAFTDLTDSGIDFTQFGEAKTAYSVVDGKNYGVPFDNGAVVACYRTDILEEAGFTLDDFTDITWDEYLEKGKVVLEKTGKPLLSCQSTESDVIMMMLQSCGASLFDDSGNPAMVGNESLKKVMETYQQLVETGVCKLVNSWDEYVQTLTTETVAGTINGCWIMASIQSAADQSGKWGLTNMPSLVGVDGATNYSNNGGSSWAITSNCKNMELAKDFLKSTFAGSVELYETILPDSGALATYLPAGDSDVYAEPSEFYGGDAVFKKITEYASKCPSNNTGVYYYEGRDAIATAIQNVVGGSDIDTELEIAQSTVEGLMEQ
ncbi:extracellular solute-binding protein [Petralouisia muris]|uniref:Extracellular solute-binding protein n=1 Tax=Petralouisia muris TaxID=3032872 RepID=A0AC61RYI7_9FIRM|nr:extracellular solute-binding protein [Petralouisia muris]TGY97120.1 extracellular solute-binding protein [Petralouisia muris]